MGKASEETIRGLFGHHDYPEKSVTFEGRTIAIFQYRFWEVRGGGNPDVMKATREAIFSMANFARPEDMRREIADRYLAIIDEKG